MTTSTPEAAARDAAARALIERVTRSGAPVASESPLVFDDGFPGRLVSLSEEGDVRSACGVLVRDFLLSDGGTVRGGLIGSVCTDPDFQRRGYATRVLTEAEAALAAEGCAFALLWADSAPFYLERGYSPIGAEDDYALDAAAAQRLPQAGGVRALHVGDSGDVAAVHALYEDHAVRVARTAEETAALLGCPGMRTLVLERDGAPRAYACCGRGQDFPNVVHEWGGAVEDVLALVRAHHTASFPDGDGELYLVAPTAGRALARRLAELDVRHARGILGLGKVLDRDAVAALLNERLQPAGSATVVDGPAGRTIRIQGPKDDDVLDDDGVLAILLGPSDVRPHVEDFLARFGLEQATLPLEPFAWGLDSI